MAKKKSKNPPKSKEQALAKLPEEVNLPGKPLRLHEFDFIAFSKSLYDKNVKFTDGRRVGEVVIDGVPQFIGLSDGQKEVVESPARFKVLAAGRRFGKCQAFGSTVQLADGSIHTIESLIGKDVEINALDENFNYVKAKASVHYNAKVPVYKIRTKYGSELVRTGNHPLLTSLGWGSIDTGELKLGTRIAFPTNNPNVGTGKFDKNLLALLGLLIGDGSMSGTNFMFTVHKDRTEAIEDFINLTQNKVTKYEYPCRNAVQYYLSKDSDIYRLCKEVGLIGKKSKEKFIPDFIFKLDKEHIAHFLSYLYFTDGWYSKNEIGYSSTSRRIVEGVRVLLSRLGIVSSIRTKTINSGAYKGHISYTVDVRNSQEMCKFESIVNIKFKKSSHQNTFNSYNAQITTMPREFSYSFSKKLIKLMPYSHQESLHGRIRPDRAVSKEKMLKYCDLFPSEFNREAEILNSDLYWDEIVSIEYQGEQDTAHLEVPKYHNYVNEAIEHNSKLCALLALAALLQPNRLVILVAPEHTHVEKVFKELMYILVTQLKLVTKGANDGTIVRNTKGDYVIQLKNGSKVEGKSGTNPDSLAGDAVDLYIFDEAGLENNLENLWGIARPALSDNKGSAVFISSPRGRNDFYKLFKLGELGSRQRSGLAQIIVKGEESNDMTDWAAWSFPSHKNPFIPPEEYHNAKREALMKGEYEKFKQEWDADFNAVTDVAFPEFRAFVTNQVDGKTVQTPYHVQDYRFDPRNGPWFASCDFNVAKPASTVYMQIDVNNNIIIFDELFRPQTDAKLQAQFILEKQQQLGVPYTMVFGDRAGGFQRSGVNEFTLMEGVLGHAPYAEYQGRETGNHLLHQYLAVPVLDKFGNLIMDEFGNPQTFPKLFVASHCHETIHAFESAKRTTGKNGASKDDYAEFKTGHEGLLDAIRYALVCIFKPRNGLQVIKGIQ